MQQSIKQRQTNLFSKQLQLTTSNSPIRTTSSILCNPSNLQSQFLYWTTQAQLHCFYIVIAALLLYSNFTRQDIIMNNEMQVMGYHLTPDHEVQLHSYEELQALLKKKIIGKEVLEYNTKLTHFLETRNPQAQTEQEAAKRKKIAKDIAKLGHLTEVDKIMIMNNRYANEAELLLKVPATEALPPKDRKHLVEALRPQE